MENIMDRDQLFFGDNLDVLRNYIKDESVDLIYLDPPFNSNKVYNVIYTEQSEAPSELLKSYVIEGVGSIRIFYFGVKMLIQIYRYLTDC